MKQTLRKIFKSYIKTTGKTKSIFILFFWLFVSFIIVIEPWIFTKIIVVIESYYETKIFDTALFINLIILWSVFIIFSIIISFIYRYYFIGIPWNINFKYNLFKYSKKIIDMSYGNYLWKETWAIYKTLDRWTDYQFNIIYFFFYDFIKSFGWILIIIWILLYVNVIMTLITLAMLPVMILFWYYFFYKLWPTQKKLTMRWNNIFWMIWNIMSNFSLTKTLHLENNFKKNIDKKLNNCLNDQLILSKWWSISDIYISTMEMLSRILVLWFWTYFMVNWKISFAELFLFFSYIWWIYFPLWIMLSRLQKIQEWLIWIKKMHTEFDNLEDDNDDRWIKIKKVEWNLEFKDVCFKYNESRTIFKKLNFSISKWEKIAFVWNTWAGKSTIINLILRFWDIDKWDILIDWIDTRTINKQSLRKNIWIVSQDNSLFNMSIKENLLFANPKANKKDLETAIKKAEASFVYDLENWIDTVIGERWLKLSWGEKQRLSIARLFLKNPKILILDEATSALDNKTEKLIQKALDKLMIWRTSIIIAHRLSTIQNVDKIFMLENWKIVESWNYLALMDKKDKFYSLANPEHLIIN